jgi:hypothetical protein
MSEHNVLTAEIADVQAQIGRADTKASMLLAGSLTSVSVGVAVIAKTALPVSVSVGAYLTVALVTVSVTLLLTAIRPALAGNHGFMRWANTPDPTALMNNRAATDREIAVYEAQRLIGLSRMARRKYRLIRLATDLLRASLLVAAITSTLTIFA